MVNSTDLMLVDRKYRLYKRSETLLTALKKRRDWCSANDVEPVHGFARYLDVQLDLQDFMALLNQHAFRLDINAIKQDTPKWLRLPVKEVSDYVFEGCPPIGTAQMTPLEEKLCEEMSERARGAIASGHAIDLQNEVIFRAHQKWFLIFGTLTVSSEHYSKVFCKNSTAWQEYIDKVDNKIAQAYAGSVRKARQLAMDYHSYFAVVEKGAQNGRLHIHVLHMVKTLPEGTEDPNYGMHNPIRREISTLRSCWQYGFTTHIAVRYGNNDAYGLSGWRWPMEKETGQGIPAKGPLAVSGYIVKYINKSYGSNSKEEYLWRVRKSRKLGRQIIQMILTNLTTEELKILATMTTIRLKLGNRLVPRKVVTLEALRILQDRLSSTQKWTMAMESEVHPSLLQRVRASTQQRQGPSSLSTGRSEMATTKRKDISDLNNKLMILGDRYTDEYYKPSNAPKPRLAVRQSGTYTSPKGNRAT